MKQIYTLLILISCSFIADAQVQIRPLPSSGFEKRIRDFVDNMPVVDTHEHFSSTANLKKRTSLDFMVLLQSYSDFGVANLGPLNMGLLLKDSLSPIEKWKILKPFWEASSNTAYSRIALLAADKLYNVKDINESTVTELSNKISAAYKSDDWFYKVMMDKCKIDFLIEDNLMLEHEAKSFGNERFRFVKRFDNFVNLISKDRINFIAKQANVNIRSVDDLVRVLGTNFKAAKEQDIVAIKVGLAYRRTLYFENVAKEKADQVFSKIMNTADGSSLSFDEVKPLQDYMMYRILDQAKLYHVTVQIHTGFQQAGNIIGNSAPTNLINLFKAYPTINFVLFHGSYPYGGELAAIAKAYGNVNIDLTWVYVLSPSYGERYLHEWLETIPASKITGFGGDYNNIDNAYGHLLFAKQVISNVLVDKVRDGYFSEAEAMKIARMMLYDNAIRIYGLSKSDHKFPEQIYYSESDH